MARPIKDGFDYIPLDVNLDKKIQAIESVFKNNGFVWIIKFWQEAYQHNDGIVNLHGYHGVIQAENSRVTLEEQNKIIEMCLEIGLLTKIGNGKYTSNGIQKRITFLLKERERWRKTNKNELSHPLSTEITPEIRGESKVKESKVKENIYGAQANACLKYFGELFLLKTGEKYHAVFGKDNKLLQSIIKSKGEDKTRLFIKKFFDSDDAFIKKAGYSVGIFNATINKLSYVNEDKIMEEYR